MAAPSQKSDLISNILASVDKLRNFLKSSHPRNVLMPGRVGKHPNGDPFKGPQFAHKNGDWTWQKSDAIQWSNVNMFGLLLKDLIVIDIDGKNFLDFYENHFPCLQQCPKENTKKGAHYFFSRTTLCDARKLYDGARALKSDTLLAEDNGVLPIDIKTVCSTGTCGFLVITPSMDKAWVPGKEPWTVAIPPIPDDFVEALVALKDSPAPVDNNPKRLVRAETSSSSTEWTSTNRFAPSWDDFELMIRGLTLSRHFGTHTYQLWTSLGWAMDNVGRTGGYRKKARDLFDEISREFPNYNEDSVQELFYKVRKEGKLLGFRYIFDRLREDNPSLHLRLRAVPRENSNISHASSTTRMSAQAGLEDTATSDAAPMSLVSPGRNYDAIKAEFEKEWFALSFPAMFVQIKYGAIVS